MKRQISWCAVALLMLCAAQSAAARNNASSSECGEQGSLPQQCGLIVVDGDSISASLGATRGHELDAQFVQALGLPGRVDNVAVSGRPVSTCLTLLSQNFIPLEDQQARFRLILFHAGDNDISAHRSASETYDAFTQYVTLAHGQGWRVAVSTEIPRLDFSPPKAAELDGYNRLLVENKAGADVVINLGLDRRFTDLSERKASSIFGGDYIHLNDAGYGILAQKLAVAVRPLLTR